MQTRTLTVAQYVNYLSPGSDEHPRFVEQCELCESTALETVTEQCRVGAGLDVESPVAKCLDCGLIFQKMRFTESFYKKYYATSYKSSVVPQERLAGYVEDQKKRGLHLYQNIRRYLKPTGRMLDVGCSTGGLLVSFQAAGWEVEGCDPDVDSVAYGSQQLGLNLVTQSAEQLEYVSEFDLIIINGSLEHVSNLSKAVHNVLRALKPDGFILIEGWALAQARLVGSFGHNQKRFLDANSLSFLFRKFGITPVFIEKEDLCGPTRPGGTYAFGNRKFI